MTRYIYLSILFLSGVLRASAQDVEAVADTAKEKTSLTLATIYSSNANYYGQTSVDRLPYVLGNASLNFPSGFFVSANAYKLLNIGSGISGVDLSAGYGFDLTNNLAASLSFTRSFFPDSSLFVQSTNLNTASATLDYDWNHFSTGLSADYIIGDQSGLYMGFTTSKSIDLGSLFSPKDYISFDPSFQVVGGTQFIATREDVPDNGGGSSGPPLIPVLGKKDKNFLLPPSKNNNPQYREIITSSFDLLSYNIRLPISYNRASYAIEAAYQGTVLSNKVQDSSQKLQSFFNLGFYYIF